MEFRGDLTPVPGSSDKDAREALIMLMRVEGSHARLQRDLEKLDAQINGDGGIKDRLAETRTISAERYMSSIRRQNCAYVVAAGLIIGIVTWFTVQFGQMRDRDLIRQQLMNPQTQGTLPSTIKP